MKILIIINCFNVELQGVSFFYQKITQDCIDSKISKSGKS